MAWDSRYVTFLTHWPMVLFTIAMAGLDIGAQDSKSEVVWFHCCVALGTIGDI